LGDLGKGTSLGRVRPSDPVAAHPGRPLTLAGRSPGLRSGVRIPSCRPAHRLPG